MFEPDGRVFTALADPTRRKLMGQLAADSPKTATQLTRDFCISRQGLLKHLALLEAAGLVVVKVQGREKRYSLSPEPLQSVNHWIEAIGQEWQTRLLGLKEMVENQEDIASPSTL